MRKQLRKSAGSPIAKTLTLVIVALFALVNANATTYYTTGTTPDIGATASWWTNTNGTGSNPGGFTTSGDIFIVQSAATGATVSTNLTIGTGVTLQIDGAITGPTSAGGRTLTINGTLIFTNTGANQLTGSKVTLTIGTATTVTLKTANAFGFSGTNGSINTAGLAAVPTFPTTINYEFTGTGNQAVTGMPGTVNSLTINNTGNPNNTVTIPATTITTTLTVTAGTLATTGAVSVGTTTSVAAAGSISLGGQLTATGNLSNSGTITTNTQTVIFGGDFTNSGTFTAGSSAIQLTGTNTQSIAGFTTTGAFSANKTSGTATLTGNVSAGALGVINACTLNMGSGLTHSFSGNLSISNASGTLNGGSSTVTFTSTTFSVTKTGTFTVGTSTIEYGASGTQTISNLLSPYYNLKVSGSNTKTLGGATTVSNGFVVAAGTLATGANTLTVNGASNSIEVNATLSIDNASGVVALGGNSLTIKSDATGSGRIGAVTTGGQLTGATNVTVQRFTAAKTVGGSKKWSMISSPVTAVTIENAWANKTGGLAANNTYMTGGISGTACTVDATTGYDIRTSSDKSLYTFDGTAYQAVSNIRSSATLGTNYAAGTGFLMYVYGPRSSSCATMLYQNGVTTAVTLAPTGTVNNATSYSINLAGGGNNAQYSLIGNPYPCEIDFNSIATANTSNIQPNYYIWNAYSGNPSNSYMSYNSSSGLTAGSASGSPLNTANARYIASGQAFFVQNKAGGGSSVTISQTDKVTLAQTGMQRSSTSLEKIRINYTTAADNSLDDIVVAFIPNAPVSTNTLTDYDTKTFNSGSYIASVKATSKLSIQSRPSNFTNDTVPVFVAAVNTGSYKFSFTEQESFQNDVDIYLKDEFTGTETNIRTTPIYSFDITSNTASQGSSRFYLVFKSSSVLPVTFLNIKANNKATGVEVAWNVASEQGVSSYVVERSANGRDFASIGSVQAKGTALEASYGFMDLKPFSGVNYYRVKSVDTKGEAKYSSVVKVNSAKADAMVSIYPNPAKDNINLNISNGDNFARATVVITNAQGKAIRQIAVSFANGNASVDVSNLATGIYYLTVVNTNGERIIEKFIKQ